jgi:biopolymer transport protein ExbD
MAFSNSSGAGAPMCDINTTPLVDVMLVLLIIFMITAPMMTNKTDAKVPLRSINQIVPPTPPTIKTVDVLASAGTKPSLALEGVPIDMPSLMAQLKLEAAKGKEAMAEINIRTAPDANYEHMALTLAAIKSTGVEKIRFDELNPPGLVQAPGAAAPAQ